MRFHFNNSSGDHWRLTRRRGVWFAGVLLLAGAAYAAESFKEVVLVPPRPVGAQEALWLKLTLGRLLRGSLLLIATADGQALGSVSPFGATPGQAVADYTLALPTSVTRGDAVRLRIQLREPNGTLRAPSPSELLDSSLVYVPVSH